MNLNVESPAASMSRSAEQDTRVVHPDSSGQPVQPPTPLKSTWNVSLEIENMEEEEEENVMLMEKEEEEKGEDTVVVEENQIVEEEVVERATAATEEEQEQEHGPMTSAQPSSLSSCQLYSSQTKERNNSDPSSCCNCKCLELLKRVDALETALKKMSKEAPAAARSSMSSATTSSDIQLMTPEMRMCPEKLQKTPNSACKGERVLKGGMKGTLYEKAIDDLRVFKLSGRNDRKAVDNAKQVATHCLRFCYYMVGNMPESATKQDLRFLARVDKLRNFPNYLKKKGYMPTTIRNMLLNVVSLYNHVKTVFLEESRLKVEDIDRVLYELTRLQAENRRDVVIQQQRVKRQKTNNQLESEQELSFLDAAKRTIPLLMDAMEKGTFKQNDHSTLMGYLMGYLCIISGHRSVVLTSLTKEHVANADQWNDGRRFQVLEVGRFSGSYELGSSRNGSN